MLGIMRAGFTAFLISPHTPLPALTHLLSTAGVSHVLVDGEPVLWSNLASAVQEVDQTTGRSLRVHSMPKHKDLFQGYSYPFKPFPEHKFDLDAHALIIHSTGTSSSCDRSTDSTIYIYTFDNQQALHLSRSL